MQGMCCFEGMNTSILQYIGDNANKKQLTNLQCLKSQCQRNLHYGSHESFCNKKVIEVKKKNAGGELVKVLRNSC